MENKKNTRELIVNDAKTTIEDKFGSLYRLAKKQFKQYKRETHAEMVVLAKQIILKKQENDKFYSTYKGYASGVIIKDYDGSIKSVKFQG